MDVRFPNGAQCTFGGWGASFIELCVSSSSSKMNLVLMGHPALSPR
jgi:hypothetical protein